MKKEEAPKKENGGAIGSNIKFGVGYGNIGYQAGHYIASESNHNKKEEKPTKKENSVFVGKFCGRLLIKSPTNCVFVGDHCVEDTTEADITNCVVIGDHLPMPETDNSVVVGDILWGKPVTKEFREFIINNVEHIKRLLRSNYVIQN